MSDPDFVIPFDRLPERFAESVEDPPAKPATPRPAATIVLLREGGAGTEVLLMRRNRNAGFVPGAYVFPGGRVDSSDATSPVFELLEGLTPDAAAARLGLHDADPPAIAYYLAALREAFEETGILVGTRDDGSPIPPAATDREVDRVRNELMEDRIDFAQALHRIGGRIDGSSIEYIAHWITPVPEPRRYDARFFAAKVVGDSTPLVDPREMTDALWTTPSEALRRLDTGSLPMIFPTIKTLEQLAPYASPDETLDQLRGSRVRTILPRLVLTSTGIGTELDEED